MLFMRQGTKGWYMSRCSCWWRFDISAKPSDLHLQIQVGKKSAQIEGAFSKESFSPGAVGGTPMLGLVGRSVDLKSHAFPISPLTMSGTKIMHLSIVLPWNPVTVDYLEFMVLTTWSKTTLWQLQATCLTRLVAEVASKNCIQWMSSLIELHEDSLCLRINQLNVNVYVLCFYAVFLSKRSTRFTLWMVNTDCCERFGNYQQFWNTNPFQNVEGFVQERSTFFTSWIMPLQLMVRCCGCERRAKPGIHSTFKIMSFPFQNSQLLDILHITKLLAPPHRSPAPCPDPASLQKWYPPLRLKWITMKGTILTRSFGCRYTYLRVHGCIPGNFFTRVQHTLVELLKLPSEKETDLPTIIFQGRAVKLPGSNFW